MIAHEILTTGVWSNDQTDKCSDFIHSLSMPFFGIWDNMAADHPQIRGCTKGWYSEAEPLYKKALEIAEHSLGVNHPNTIKIYEILKFLRADHPEQQSS